MKIFALISFFFLNVFVSSAQIKDERKESSAVPKLVVAVVVDQMRYDYIYRYWNRFEEGGFKRLINEGFACKNTKFDYVPTFTAPGHASIFTGASPYIHGIIANTWYSKELKRPIYCTDDKTVKPVGGSAKAGLMSPRNMLTGTFCDELRMSSNFKSKVIGISLKDRGAILPAGHTANAAYWLDNSNGAWITSSFYMEKLPEWVIKFNERKYPHQVLKGRWETFNSMDSYSSALEDNNKYEGRFSGAKGSSFPHDLALAFKKDSFEVIRYTPFGNTLTKDFAIEAIKSEKLGKNQTSDIITISFSAPDYVGHKFGPSSIEMEDTYIRLDKDIAELLSFLDKEIGEKSYLFFLTADHAAPEVPKFMMDNRLPGGYFNAFKNRDSLNLFLAKKYNIEKLVEAVDNQQLFLNQELIKNNKLNRAEVENEVVNFYLTLPGVTEVFPAHELAKRNDADGIKSYIQKGFNTKRSGDVVYVLAPGWVEYFAQTGTTHGSPYSYDTHVPLIWYGTGIKKGFSVEPVNITDIAPTVSLMLNINFPGSSTGKPIKSLFSGDKN